MRRAARIDGNHNQIVYNLRKACASVQSLATVGKGCPDIVVGWKSHNFLFEIKDPAQNKYDRQLTQDEVEWHDTWYGQVDVIETAEQAIKLMEQYVTRK